MIFRQFREKKLRDTKHKLKMMIYFMSSIQNLNLKSFLITILSNWFLPFTIIQYLKVKKKQKGNKISIKMAKSYTLNVIKK